jgi:hypothetical protein
MPEPLALAWSWLRTGWGIIQRERQQERDEPLDRRAAELETYLHIVAGGIVAAALDCDPGDAKAQDFLANLHNAPAFAARFNRLVSEFFRSPSTIRKKRLLAVLIAGPSITENDADRDRLDLLAEQLLEEDLRTLAAIVEFRNKVRDPEPAVPDLNLHRSSLSVSLNPPHFLAKLGKPERRLGAPVDMLSIERLVGASCLVRSGPGLADGVPLWTLGVTRLGEFLYDRMNHPAIRAGVAGS